MEVDNFPNVGKAIRDIRQNQNLSLRDLSKLCDLSTNALSKIERGENSPTVSSLHKISAALNVHISSFFIGDVNQTVIVTRKSQAVKLDLDGLIFEGLGSGLVNQKIEPFLITIPPGSENSTDPSSHAGEEFLYCLKGQLEYTIANTKYVISEGDSILFKASQAYSWKNKSDVTAKILLLFEKFPSQNKPHNQTLIKELEQISKLEKI